MNQSLQWKQLNHIMLPMIKFNLSNKNYNSGKSTTVHLTASLPISSKVSVSLTNRSFFISQNKICQPLEDLHYSVSHYFPNDRCMGLPNHAWNEDLPIDFKAAECEIHWYGFRVHMATALPEMSMHEFFM